MKTAAFGNFGAKTTDGQCYLKRTGRSMSKKYVLSAETTRTENFYVGMIAGIVVEISQHSVEAKAFATKEEAEQEKETFKIFLKDFNVVELAYVY